MFRSQGVNVLYVSGFVLFGKPNWPCLDQTNLIFLHSSGSNSVVTKIKHHEYALDLLLEGVSMLGIISDRDAKFYDEEEIVKPEAKRRKSKEEEAGEEKKSELESELLLLAFYEQRLQFNLLSLTKLHMNRNDGKKGSSTGEMYKKLYAMSLRVKCSKENPVEFAKALLSLVSDVSASLNSDKFPS